MREWIDELSDYIQKSQEVVPPLVELSEEMHTATLETDFLLQASDQMQSAYSSILEKAEHVNAGR